MMNSRWQANKIGLINFWYYRTGIPFVKGRMLLRGSNGSGIVRYPHKISNQMQSEETCPSSGWKKQ